jgi:hypothetical protein
MVVGDLHGQVGQMDAIGREAARHQIDTIVQVGDFGLWPGKEVSWFNHVEAAMSANGVNLLIWIDGNHENHSQLKWLAERQRDADGLVTMRGQDGDGPLVCYAPRGSRWVWSGVRFGTLGGAFSVDHSMRQAGQTWWPGAGPGGEEPSQEEADRLITGGPLDVLFSHDAPTMVDLANISTRAASRFLPESDERRSPGCGGQLGSPGHPWGHLRRRDLDDSPTMSPRAHPFLLARSVPLLVPLAPKPPETKGNSGVRSPEGPNEKRREA